MRPCPVCAADNAPEARFCSRCGKDLRRSCPACDAELPVAAVFCASCGRRVATEDAGEERKIVTVVFADLVGSTANADGQDPERTRWIQSTFFSAMAAAVEAWGGTVEKYIGDAVMAVFGVPTVREDDAARALHAAAEMRRRLDGVNASVAAVTSAPLAVRIGVNTGEVVAPATRAADEGLVTGDAVNLAARLEQAAGPGEILVGERTRARASEGFVFGPPIELQVKGKRGPIRASALLDRPATVLAPARPGRGRLIGRDQELPVLSALLDEVIATRRPRVALVVGPPGIGKSRLVRDWLAQATEERPDLTTLIGRCPTVGLSVTYWAMGEIIRAACGIALDDVPAAAAAKLEARVGQLFARDGTEDLHALVGSLAITAGIPLADDPLAAVRPIALAAQLGRDWPRFLGAMASRSPTVVVVEDVHWASEPLLEMLQRIAARSVGPLLMVLTARPELRDTQPEFLAGSDTTLIDVRPLRTAGTIALLGSLLGVTTVPPELQELVVDRADGNPFFVEEIVQTLMDRGSLVRRGDRWTIVGPADRALPDTIQGVLAARIDALDPADKRLLQEASVIGRAFWEAPLRDALPAVDVDGSLARLERRGLVAQRIGSQLSGQVEYTFKHALVREVAYAGLPLKRRARAHAAIGSWLAERVGSGSEGLTEVIGAQYFDALTGDGAELTWSDPAERAEVHAAGFRALLAAGAAARRRNARAAAIAFHERALQLAADDAERAEAQEAIGDTHDAAFHGDLALEAWEAALALRTPLPAGSGDDERARLHRNVAAMAAVRWGGFHVPVDPARIDRHVDAGLEVVRDEEVRAWLWALRGKVGTRWLGVGRPDPLTPEARIEATASARQYAERTGSHELGALVAQTESALQLAYGQPALAIDAARRQVAAGLAAASARDRVFYVSLGLHMLLEVAGEYEGALAQAGPVLALARELSPHDTLHMLYVSIRSRFLLGRWAEALPLIEEHERVFRDEDDMACPFVRGGMAMGGLLHALRGDIGSAQRFLGAIPMEVEDAYGGIVEGIVGQARLALGDPAGAREIVAPLVATGRMPNAEEPPLEFPAMLELLAAEHDWAELDAVIAAGRERVHMLALMTPALDRATGARAIDAGRTADAHTALEQAVAGYRRLGVVYEVARTQSLLADVVEGPASAALRDEATQTFRALGARDPSIGAPD